ncbi:MAG: GAF domain-containing protein, partial [Betaproteobacteria bacterium]
MKKKKAKKSNAKRVSASSRETLAALKKTIAAEAQEIQEGAEQQTATSEILRVIASSPNSRQRVLDVVARNAARLCEASDALIVRVDGNSHIPVASYGALAPTHGILTSRGSPAGRAILDRQTLHIHDLAVKVETEFPEVSEFQKRLGHRSMVATPLLRDGIAIGAILVRRLEVRPFTDSHIKLLKTFADQAVIAIENARLIQEREAAGRDLAALHDVTTAASRSLEIKPVLDEVVKKITEIFHFDAVRIFVFDEARETSNYVASFGMSEGTPAPIAFRRGQGIQGRVAETGEPIIFENVKTDPRYKELSQSKSSQRDYSFFGTFPIKAKGKFAGTISCLGKKPRQLSPEEVRLINSMCDQIGIAVDNINLFEEVRKKTADLE